MKKIVICGGHFTPALALIENLKSRKDIQIVFFGRKYSTEGAKNYSAEYKVITSQKIKFVSITTGRLQRRFTKYTLPSLAKIPLGFVQSFFNLILTRPSLIVSFGSYLSVPVVASGWLLGVDCVSFDQATVPGLATKINSIFSEKVFLTWPQAKKYFSKEKVEVIGNLIRPSLYQDGITNNDLASFLTKSKNIIFVTGGNQGSHFLNKLVSQSLPQLSSFSIVHQVGTVDFEKDHQKAKMQKTSNYFPVDYLDSSDFGTVLKKAKIVISRSGANTVWELASFAKVSILIPLPISASNEQMENAKILQNAGSASIILQNNATPKVLRKEISEIEKDFKTFDQKAKDFAGTLPKNPFVKISRYF